MAIPFLTHRDQGLWRRLRTKLYPDPPALLILPEKNR
jgi:hypothetical protein